MKRFCDEQVIVFHRIVGANDDGIMAALHAWFPVLTDYEYECGSLEEFLAHPLDEDVLSPLCLVAGFWNRPEQSPQERYPRLFSSEAGWRMTFLRDPFDVFVSFYAAHIRASRMTSEEIPFQPFFLSNLNYIARSLRIETLGDLEAYKFIGILTDPKASAARLRCRLEALADGSDDNPDFRRMTQQLGKPIPSVAPMSMSDWECEVRREICAAQREEFERVNELDYAIWNEALVRHDAEASALR